MLIRPLDENNLLPSITDEPEIYQLQEPYVSLPPKINNYFPTKTDSIDTSSINLNLIGGGVAGVNSIGTINCENIAVLDDLCNFGYKVKIQETGATLNRIGKTSYADSLSSVLLSLIDYDLGWQLTTTDPYNIYYNNKQVPIGLFTGTQTLSVIYTNE